MTKGIQELGVLCAPCKAQKVCLSMQNDIQNIIKHTSARLKKMLDALRAEGKDIAITHGRTAEELMYWWIHNADIDLKTHQTKLEELEGAQP